MRFDELPGWAWFTFADDYPIGELPVVRYQKRLIRIGWVAWSEDTGVNNIIRRDSEVTEHERRG